MTATHTQGCPALDDPRDGCACLLPVAAQGESTPHRVAQPMCPICAYNDGYAAALDAAREAVYGAPILDVTDGPEGQFVLRLDAALAAIAALKEKP